MAILYSEASTEVLANLEIDSSDKAKFKVDEHLNAAQREIFNRVSTAQLHNVIVDDTAPALTINITDYAFPTNYFRFVELWLNYLVPIDVDNQGRRCEVYDRTLHARHVSELGTQNFPFVDIDTEGEQYSVSPKPTATVAGAQRIKYIKTPLIMATGVDSELHERFKDLLISYATGLSANVDNYRPDLAKTHMGIFESGIKNYLPKSEAA